VKIQELSFKTGNQSELERRITESDSRLNSVGQQLEALNRQLQAKTAENNELINKLRNTDSDTNRITVEIR
jgi:CII-binding regulator of phage lambda lysogenization HflD